jgi:hypothetical protein
MNQGGFKNEPQIRYKSDINKNINTDFFDRSKEEEEFGRMKNEAEEYFSKNK